MESNRERQQTLTSDPHIHVCTHACAAATHLWDTHAIHIDIQTCIYVYHPPTHTYTLITVVELVGKPRLDWVTEYRGLPVNLRKQSGSLNFKFGYWFFGYWSHLDRQDTHNTAWCLQSSGSSWSRRDHSCRPERTLPEEAQVAPKPESNATQTRAFSEDTEKLTEQEHIQHRKTPNQGKWKEILIGFSLISQMRRSKPECYFYFNELGRDCWIPVGAGCGFVWFLTWTTPCGRLKMATNYHLANFASGWAPQLIRPREASKVDATSQSDAQPPYWQHVFLLESHPWKKPAAI